MPFKTFDGRKPNTVLFDTVLVPSPPENLLGEVVSPGTVRLKWGPPKNQNGIIRFYIIYYNVDKDQPDQVWNSIQQNGNVLTYKFTLNIHKIISSVILPLPLIRERKWSVTGESACTKYWLTTQKTKPVLEKYC